MLSKTKSGTSGAPFTFDRGPKWSFLLEQGALYTDWYSKTIYMDGRLFLAAYLHINLITEVKMSSGDAKETDA